MVNIKKTNGWIVAVICLSPDDSDPTRTRIGANNQANTVQPFVLDHSKKMYISAYLIRQRYH